MLGITEMLDPHSSSFGVSCRVHSLYGPVYWEHVVV